MDKKFLKRYIEECPLTDFTDNGNVNERLLQLKEAVIIKNMIEFLFDESV